MSKLSSNLFSNFNERNINMDTFTENNLGGAIIKTVFDWFYGTQERIYIKADIENVKFTSTYPLPQSSIQQDQVLVHDANRPGESLQLVMKSMIFNINLESVGSLRYDFEGIEFQARFDGRATSIYIPYEALVLIYNPNNNVGWQNSSFIPSSLKRISVDDSQQKPVEKEPEAPKKSHLSIVKTLH